MNDEMDPESGSGFRYVTFFTTVLCLFLFVITPSSLLQAQEASSKKADVQIGLENGFIIQAPDTSVVLRIGFRFQEQFSSVYDIDENDTNAEFQLRRFRLIFSGHAFDGKLTWFLMPSFDRGNASLEIVRVRWQLGKNSWIYGGQINQPGTREFLETSGSLQFVDRSTTDRLFRLGYDAGLGFKQKMYPGNSALVGIATITNGEGQNQRAADGGLSYTGRLEFYPFGEFNMLIGTDFDRSKKPKVAFAGAFNLNQDARRTRSQNGPFLIDASEDIYVYFLETSLRYRGFSFHSAFVNRNADDNLLNDGIPQNIIFEGYAYYFEAGYLFSEEWEIVSRFERIFPEQELRASINEQRSMLIGINKFFLRHRLKIQADLAYDTEFHPVLEDADFLTFRTQFQIEF
jgi:phosphate-selective porin OprO and OprP